MGKSSIINSLKLIGAVGLVVLAFPEMTYFQALVVGLVLAWLIT